MADEDQLTLSDFSSQIQSKETGNVEEQEVESAPVRLENFHRSETKNGKKVWEIKARSGSLVPEKSAVRISDATLWLFRDEGEVTELQAVKALVFIEGAELRRAEASEGVRLIHSDGSVITTKTAIYDREHGSVSAPGYVEIENESLMTTGEELTVDLNEESFVLGKDVITTIKPKRKDNGSQ